MNSVCQQARRTTSSLSKYGVAYNLEQSPYGASWTDEVTGRMYEFCFSTVKHRDKFLSMLYKRIPWMNDSMSRRFHVVVDVSVVAVLQLYMQIETRGFLVRCGDDLWQSPEEVSLVGLQIK